jgi:hypothetical protein
MAIDIFSMLIFAPLSLMWEMQVSYVQMWGESTLRVNHFLFKNGDV